MGKQIIIYKHVTTKEDSCHQLQSKQEQFLNTDSNSSVFSTVNQTMMSENSDEDQFTCRYCEKVLYSARSLQIHEDRHTETLKYRCIYCDKTFPSQSSMTRHERTHTGEKEYPCVVCEAGFREKKSLVNHITKMHPMHVDNCDLTQSVSVDRKAYLANMESIKSSQNKQIQPPPQIRNFPIQSSKSENYVSTTTKSEGSKEARFQCGYCDKSFATPSKVKRHILTHTGEKPFVCQFCQRGFSQKVHMMEHISKHHADESLKAQQEAAAAAAAQAAVAQAAAPAPLIKTISQRTPVYATHTIANVPVICSSQSLRLPTSQTQTITATQVMADTTAVQIPIPENSYIVAEFSLKTEPHISPQHEQVEDEDQQEIMATIPLSQHNSLTYPAISRSPVSTYECQSPSFQTVTQSNERPFVCPHCSADFIRQSNLSVHMMKVHGEAVEVRTHQCSYCDKKFKYPNKRRLHEMTHTGEKPNVCQFCTMGFFKKSRLRVHLTKHHGIPEEEVNNPNSTYLQNPNTPTQQPATNPSPPLTTTQTLIQKTIQQIQSNGTNGDHFCQYCQKPFSNKQDLLAHERQEAMEFEQLHEMFEDSEFTGLGVGNGSQTDIIQNALLTAGIENGLGSPSVTDSDSVVTISEADIDSFSIGFIPDANWSNEVVSTNLPNITTSNSDPFYPAPQPLDLNVKQEQSQSIETSSQDLQSISGTIYTTSETFQNIKTEPPSLPNLTGEINQIWETTVALSTLPANISTTLNSIIKTEPLLSTAQGEIFTTSSAGLNGIYTETFTIPGNQQLTQDTMSTSIINLANPAQIINGNELDFSKLTTTQNFSVTTQQNFMEQDGLTTTFQTPTQTQNQTLSIQPTSTSRIIQPIIWADDPTLPAGWKTRQHFREGQANKVDTYYMAPDGTQFRSKWKVVEYMESCGSYCQEEIDWVRNSITTPRPDISIAPKERSDKLKREWKDDDQTVPNGWKVAWTTTSDNRSKIAFMSPDKKIFHSRKAALQHMMQAGTYDPDDIVKMTKGLNVLLNVGDEWKEGDKSLPEGWKIRSHQWWCQKRNSHRIHYEFLSPLNEFFKSRKAVVEHMTQSGSYSQHQIEMVKQQTTIVTDRSTKKRPAAPTRQDLSPCNPLIGWKAGNSSLPAGWKIKRHEYANQTVYFYMSPKGEIIKSRRAVMDYMFEEGTYNEKDFSTVISGAKQRKVALQELYDARLNKRNKKKKRSKSFAKDDSEITPDEQDDHDIDSDEELDEADDDDEDKLDDAKKCHKKQKIEKEPVLPTRRSGRIKIKEKRRELDSDNEGSDSDLESPVMTHKRRYSSTDPETASPELKRKRGRPPKAAQSFDYLETGDEQDLITDTLMKVEEKMGDSLVKLEGALFKVELTSETDIKDFDLSSQNIDKFSDSIEIKLEEAALGNAIKEELEFDQNHPNSIHCNQNAIEKVTEFFVDGRNYSVSTKLVTDEIYSSNAALDSIENSVDSHNNSAYAVVVNVLNDIVSSISE